MNETDLLNMTLDKIEKALNASKPETLICPHCERFISKKDLIEKNDLAAIDITEWADVDDLERQINLSERL